MSAQFAVAASQPRSVRILNRLSLPGGSWVGVAIIAVFILVAALAPLLVHSSTNRTVTPWLSPSGAHLLGTDNYGQDVLSQLILGSRVSVAVGTLAGLLAGTIGVTVGLVAGYAGGLIGELLMRIVDVLLTLPTLALLIIVAAFVPSLGNAAEVLIIGCLSWLFMARSVRSQTLSERARGYVDVARVSGLSHLEVMGREIFPNVLPIAVSNLVLVITAAILAQASLSFLGIGTPNAVSWGQMLALSYTDDAMLRGAWWWIVPPGLCIAFFAYGFVLLGNGILDRYTGSREIR